LEPTLTGITFEGDPTLGFGPEGFYGQGLYSIPFNPPLEFLVLSSPKRDLPRISEGFIVSLLEPKNLNG
jgi:hypothetical protein